MKDPAFLFYSSDFITGTYFMTDEQVGKYIRLMCMQHQKEKLSEKDMLKICKTYDEDIYNKFIKDEQGYYYNKRLLEEIEKRKAYSESRRNNRKGKNKKEEKETDINNICNSYDEHMENENVIVNENININELYNKNVEKIDKIFIETLGITNLNNIRECIEYLDKLPLEVIEYALKITARNNAKWNYARTILDSYVEKGLNTLEKIQADEIEFKNKTSQKLKEETEAEKTARKIKALEEGLRNANW